MELGLLVFRITDALGAPGRKTAEAGDGLAGDLRRLSEPIGKVPVVGDQLRAPLDGAAGAAARNWPKPAATRPTPSNNSRTSWPA